MVSGEIRAENDQLNRSESLATRCFDLRDFPFPVRASVGGLKQGRWFATERDRDGGEKVKSKLESDDRRRRSWHRSPISPNTSPVHTSRTRTPSFSLLFSHLFQIWILHDAVVSFFSSVLLFGGRACFK